MSVDLGDRTEDSTIDFAFLTKTTGDVPIVLAGSPVVSVYKANGDTQSTAGITLTVDFDSVVGLNHVRIDLSADAFYAIANDYMVVITTGTVNSVSAIGTVVGMFSIENRGVATAKAVWDRLLQGNTHNISNSAGKRLRQIEQAIVEASGTIAVVTDGHTITLDAGAVATADYYIGSRLNITEGTGAGQSRIITAYTSGRVVTLDSDYTTNPDTSSIYEVDSADVHVSVSDADLAEGFISTYTNTTTITLNAGAVATADYYKGQLIIFTHGTGAGQVREITGYTSGRVVTMSPALVVALDTTTTWHIQAAVSVPEIVLEISDMLQNDALIAGVSFTETLRRQGAILAGKVTGAKSGVETFQDYAGSVNTIVITVDSSGNRSSVVFN